MSTLEILFPQPAEVRINRRRVVIRHVQLYQFEQFAAAAGAVIALLDDPTPARMHAFACRASELRAVLASTTDLGWWARRRLPLSTAIALLAQVVRVNNSFFEQALRSLVSELAAGQRASKR